MRFMHSLLPALRSTRCDTTDMNSTSTIRTRSDQRVLQRVHTAVPTALAFLTLGLLGQTVLAAPAPAAPATSVGGTNASVVKDDPIQLAAFVSTGTRFNDRTVVQ